MITSIQIENFKSLKEIFMVTRNLNIFMGLNGMGKSSVIQALLLMRQSRENNLRDLSLNGNLVEIGRGQDALYQGAENEVITINIGFNNGITGDEDFLIECSLDYQSENNVLTNSYDTSGLELSQIPLFNNNFAYLEAERTGPQTDYSMSYKDVVENRQIGKRGQYAIHYLNHFGMNVTVPNTLSHPDAKSKTLLHQVIAWMGEISPDIRLETQEISGTDKIILKYRFSTNDFTTRNFRPKNVGFGISYVLPIIVSLLSYEQDKLIIIENPESHIHPRGQARLGRLLALAAASGMQIIVETHSDHILSGVRVAVKQSAISDEDVNISYFERVTTDEEQYCNVRPIFIYPNGSLSDYPADFMDEWQNQLKNLI